MAGLVAIYFLIGLASSQTLITDIWNDDFVYDGEGNNVGSGLDGWNIYATSGSNIYATRFTNYISYGASGQYYGPFHPLENGTANEIRMRRTFTCTTAGSLYISFSMVYCFGKAGGYMDVQYLKNILSPDFDSMYQVKNYSLLKSGDISTDVDFAANTSHTGCGIDSTAINNGTAYETTSISSFKIDDIGVNGIFAIALRLMMNSKNQYGAFYDIELECRPSTAAPSDAPSIVPTQPPSLTPSQPPSIYPSQTPSQPPSSAPSGSPIQPPTLAPSVSPTQLPSLTPTQPPSLIPTQPPSTVPSQPPSTSPTQPPSLTPTQPPSNVPTQPPSISPTQPPSISPTQPPSSIPSISPSRIPTQPPSNVPSQPPSLAPTINPTKTPTKAPTIKPTGQPTHTPTFTPTRKPTPKPTPNKIHVPTLKPTPHPVKPPTHKPIYSPTLSPTDTATQKIDPSLFLWILVGFATFGIFIICSIVLKRRRRREQQNPDAWLQHETNPMPDNDIESEIFEEDDAITEWANEDVEMSTNI